MLFLWMIQLRKKKVLYILKMIIIIIIWYRYYKKYIIKEINLNDYLVLNNFIVYLIDKMDIKSIYYIQIKID